MVPDVPSESPENIEPSAESAHPKADKPNGESAPDNPDTPQRGRRLPLLVAAVLVGLLYTQSHLISTFCYPAADRDTKSGLQVPQYTVMSVEDTRCDLPVCKVYRVEVPRMMSKEELTAIADTIIREATSSEPIDALSCLFYLPDTGTSPSYTAGKADWAPDGSSKPSHNLVVYVGPAKPL